MSRNIISEEFAISDRNNSPQLRYGESEKATVKKTEYQTVTVTPEGQAPNGTNLSTGGSFYVNTSGGFTTSISFALSWNNISIGVSVGKMADSNVAGLMVNIPDKVNKYIVKLDKTYKFEYLLIDCYQYGVYKYSYYATRTTFDSLSAYCVRV